MASPADFAAHKWWKESTIYQIYPASFKSTGSGSIPGWGDIKGITSKLDYLKDLGVDIIWTSPIYKSPQIDMGYDISDYYDVDPRYGKSEHVDQLVAALKQRGMRLMMDLVVNHTSNLHEWFLQSRSGKQSPKRDWYIWQPPKYSSKGTRMPPNNWFQILGEANSAWTWDETTGEYYLSLFTAEQPDLNWRNPDVRAAVHDILRFWLDRGVSGFRMDVINLISKVEGYPDAEIVDPVSKYQPGHKLYANGPHLHEYLREMNDEVLSHYDTITVGEMPFIEDTDEILRVVGEERKELNMIFIFDLVDIDRDSSSGFRWDTVAWSIADMKRIISKWQNIMSEQGGWNSIFIENHDNPRSVSRYTDDFTPSSTAFGAKLLALLQTTLSGTLYIYQGEELGMKNFSLEWPPEEYKDIETQNYWKKMQQLYPNNPAKLQEARQTMQRKARDHSRTPVQWDSGPNAGFCDKGVEPWMRVNDDYQTVNAERQTKARAGEELSVWQFWQRCLRRRRDFKEVFVYGKFELLKSENTKAGAEDVLAYRMSSDETAFAVVLNFSRKEVQWEIPQGVEIETNVESNYGNVDGMRPEQRLLKFRPWEGIVARVAT
jgi:oligo-1,6-glucosidase